MKFKKGDSVEWTSQAGGSRARKVGEIVEVVPAGERPKSAIDSSYTRRDHESYVVNAQPIRFGGKKGARRNYWPRVSALKPVSRRQ